MVEKYLCIDYVLPTPYSIGEQYNADVDRTNVGWSTLGTAGYNGSLQDQNNHTRLLKNTWQQAASIQGGVPPPYPPTPGMYVLVDYTRQRGD